MLGNITAPKRVIAKAVAPPIATVTTGGNRDATLPARKSPNSLEEAMKIELTALTLPRRLSGVAS